MWRTSLVVALVVIGLLLRIIHLGEVRPIEWDERTFFQVGVSLLRVGVPATWSIFSGVYHGHASINCGDVTYAVVIPYLDHPPLFSLLVGLWSYAVGMRDFCALDWALVRVVMIFIAALSFGAVYLLTQKVFGETLATFSLLAFVFFPSHVVAARFVTPEHLIALLLMLGLYLFAVFETTRSPSLRRLVVFLMGALCLGSPLTKLSGVVVSASLVLLAFTKRHYWLGVLLCWASLLSALLFVGYGWYYDWDAFRSVLAAHHNRGQTFVHFWTLFTTLDLGNNFSLFDPSVIAGLVGALGLALSTKRGAGAYVYIPLIVFSFLYLYVAPWEAYGWYKYSLFPLVAVGLGFMFTQLYSNNAVYLALFLPLLSMMLQQSALLSDQADRRLMVGVFYAAALLPVVMGSRLLQLRVVFIPLLILLFAFEVLWVFRIFQYPLLDVLVYR